MASESDKPGSRVDHGDWVIPESEEYHLREVQQTRLGAPRRSGPGFLAGGLIVILLGFIAAATVVVPLLTDRPWVGPAGREEVLQGLAPGRPMKVRVVLSNTGRSPAVNLRIAVRLIVGNPPPAPSPALGECEQSDLPMAETVLFPGAVHARTVSTLKEIDDQTVAAVLRGDKIIYLAGCAQYDDSLLPWLPLGRRSTHFCRMFAPTSAGNYGVLGSFEDCPAGNSAD